MLGFAFIRFPKVIKSYKIYVKAEAKAANGDIVEAIQGLHTVVEQYPGSVPVAVRLTDIAMEGGFYDDASYVISNNLSGKKIEANTVARLNRYIDKLDRFFHTYDTVQNMQSQLEEAKSKEEVLQTGYNYLNQLLSDPEQDKALVYYYMSMFAGDAGQARSCLENSIQEDDNMLDAKVQLATLSRRQGDLQYAENCYNQVLLADKTYSSASRGLAIIRLLEGKKEEGLNLASYAYEQNAEGDYVWETYLIALKENAKNTDADALVKEYVSKGNELDADIKSYLDGNLSLHDYYIDE
ncbi:tetratricopeptide repeat protein [Lacrimispora xylanisolvens]|uniref:tetratricopeptide repeat protein n=1 Tax=Lacrimispora xylanisolvens TaxID=384636 RepID=UPI002402927D